MTIFTTSAALGPIGILFGVLIEVTFIVLNWAAERCSDLWNDPEFVELLETAEMYAEQMMFYSDCEQEAADAWCELAVYLLKKQYGEHSVNLYREDLILFKSTNTLITIYRRIET